MLRFASNGKSHLFEILSQMLILHYSYIRPWEGCVLRGGNGKFIATRQQRIFNNFDTFMAETIIFRKVLNWWLVLDYCGIRHSTFSSSYWCCKSLYLWDISISINFIRKSVNGVVYMLTRANHGISNLIEIFFSPDCISILKI